MVLPPALDRHDTTIALTLGAAAVVTAWLLRRVVPADVWIGGIVLVFLVVVGTALVHQHAQRWAPHLAQLIALAWIAKLIGAFVRYASAVELYGGLYDADAYNGAGRVVASSLRQLDVTVDVGANGFDGTGYLKLITGVVYTVIGDSLVGGFLVFAAFGFVGLYLCLRAFVRAVPDGDHRRAAWLVLLLPSALYWPSSIGKEAWVLLGLGLAADGASRLFTGTSGAWTRLGVGVLAAGAVRPHVGLALVASVAVASLVVRPTALPPGLRARRGLVTVVLLLALIPLAGRLGSVLGADLGASGGVDTALDFTSERTEQGGSSFTPARIHSPLDLPWAAVTVVLRPLPHEADSVQTLASAVEGLLLLGLAFRFRRNLTSALREARRRPWVAFVLIYALLFIVGFSSVGNFGILVRQRVQLMPLLLPLLAVPALARRRATVAAATAAPIAVAVR